MRPQLTATALALVLLASSLAVAQDSDSSSNGNGGSDSSSADGGSNGGTDTDAGTDDDGDTGSDAGDGDRGEAGGQADGGQGDDTGSVTTNDDGEIGSTDDDQDDKAGTTGTMTSTPADASEDAPGTRGGIIGSQQQTIVTDNPVYGMRGEQIVGQTVYGVDGEAIGEVEDVVGGPGATRADAVVSVGGFLGMGERDVVIPLDRIQSSGDRLTTDMTRAELEAMQPYEQGSYQPWDRSRTLGGTGQ